MNELERLKREIESDWGIDDQMDRDYIAATPLGIFVNYLHQRDTEILQWLLYSVTIRVLPCWEYHCDDGRPRKTIEKIGQYLIRRESSDALMQYMEPTEPCVDDCRESDAGSASDAIAFAARYLVENDPLIAACSISAADCAYLHLFTEDRFREWMIEVAIPASEEKRPLSQVEEYAYRVKKRIF
jgi:hypothetical protein